MKTGLVLSALLLISGCGYFTAGTWEDDTNNWQRAFYSKKPKEVVVVHSRYTRYPHWTAEYTYYFEVEQNDSLLNHFIEVYKLEKVEVDSKKFTEAISAIGAEPPKWFVPRKRWEEYEIYSPGNDDWDNFRLFLDSESKTIFLCDHQI